MDNLRAKALNQKPINPNGRSVVYIMSRDQRLADNHALLLAQQSALKLQLPLTILFALYPNSGFRAQEHYQFMLDGLKQLELRANKLNISFKIIPSSSYDFTLEYLNVIKPAELFFDFNPLKGPTGLQSKIAKSVNYKANVVDTHNIIPVWITSDKEEYGAHTIRPKIHKNLANWVIEPAKLIKHPYTLKNELNNWPEIYKSIDNITKNNSQTPFVSGENEALKCLDLFILNNLNHYAKNRNNPNLSGQSNLSPYLHFGQISALRIALNIIKTINEPPLLFKVGKLASFEGQPSYIDSVNAYLEELIVRKELADNFCYYNSNYNNFEGAKDWAKKSLIEHLSDKREYLYSLDQFKLAQTHDMAWNSAQREMANNGKMHGYMRMYWAKKILEWSESPDIAIKNAIYLNDFYSLDGGDPNGYTGIMWSIAGIHDRPWLDREIYGKIRYMNSNGLKTKFDLQKYINTYSV